MTFYNVKAEFFVSRIDAGQPVALEINPKVFLVSTRLPDELQTDDLAKVTFVHRQNLKVDEFCIRGPLLYKGAAREVCIPWQIVYALTDGTQHCIDWKIISSARIGEFTREQCREAYREQCAATWTGDVSVGRGFDWGKPQPKLQALEGGDAPDHRRAWDARERRAKFRVISGGKS